MSDEPKRLTRKELAREMRRDAYRRAKDKRNAAKLEAKQRAKEAKAAGIEPPPDPKQAYKDALKERAKAARQAAYQKAKERKKALAKPEPPTAALEKPESDLWAMVQTANKLKAKPSLRIVKDNAAGNSPETPPT